MAKQNSPIKSETPNELLELEQELTEFNPEVFKGVNPKKKLEILRSFSVTMIQEKSHSGPLPDSESLIQYNSVIPEGADRIMKMAERQQEHRMSIEKRVISSQSQQSGLGQVFGLIIGIVGIASGTYLASIGATTVGGIIAGGTVVSLVSVFVIGKNTQKNKES
ncbi:DUF2335 domain-containing protein [Wenyingzhuangia sp. 2_MG-2023]|uniref:DUF2335 domain-containing protein n=1 Tax=Wenyingzhuangia sp. 2_MG-2023 TaxID=3062639 RepID=UPI0026E47D32|nr:DUF2335 domain-containing protein [Wenyingzhuangia sp. 2_MG-2023]MDO6738310.1 DUF2335 domain-containing protein [Wenyingzhuangia sp. 2_MG-2023]